jgi:hypothetical protein
MAEKVTTVGDIRVLRCAPDGPPLRGPADALDVLGEAFGAQADLVVVPVERLDPGFFTLSTGIAGEIVQKFVNYRMRLVVEGDIGAHLAASSALRAFVAESDRGRQLWFVARADDLAARLSA